MVDPVVQHQVYLLDDHEVVRRGLEHLLEGDGVRVIGSSGSAREAGRMVVVLQPHAAVLDDRLPDGFGTGVCNTVGLIDTSIHCVILTDEEGEGVLVESMLSGAWGCLAKGDSAVEHLRLVRLALSGHPAYSRDFESLGRPVRGDAPGSPESVLLSLTRQERRVAIHVAAGMTNRQIAHEMVLAEKTVKNTVSAILAKLDMARRTQLAVIIALALDEMGGRAAYLVAHGVLPDEDGTISRIIAGLMRSDPGGLRPTSADRLTQTLRLAEALVLRPS
ncbi:DNA-binding response regulator [Arthrobacter pityocampae]|uniref:DNA-binding response regulator n=1 Tax=Arthrobacter pityocampae TaxID=547334 RepID=A0A2S5IZ87_9MICC|nr:response regulator transcription factor [Arthrobacter pityocampae]PPB49853.1 DNA-binding response regulator [Arthrobacter pityocampae]